MTLRAEDSESIESFSMPQSERSIIVPSTGGTGDCFIIYNRTNTMIYALRTFSFFSYMKMNVSVACCTLVQVTNAQTIDLIAMKHDRRRSNRWSGNTHINSQRNHTVFLISVHLCLSLFVFVR